LVLMREPGTPDPGKVSGGAWFGLTIAGVYLGVAEAARDAAIAFAQQRKPTALKGQSIATLETIQRLVGTLEAELLTARALLYAVADAWSAHPEQRSTLMPHIGVCKVVATTHAVKATDLALRVVAASQCRERCRLSACSVMCGQVCSPTHRRACLR
jgi:alkylation response protein AidB-like acyl-CoA dehydrogenase